MPQLTMQTLRRHASNVVLVALFVQMISHDSQMANRCANLFAPHVFGLRPDSREHALEPMKKRIFLRTSSRE